MKQDSIRIAADSQAKFNNNTAFCIGTGRMGLALQQEYQQQLAMAQAECAFTHIRGHGLFSDDMAIYQPYQDAEGNWHEGYNFNYLDRVMDDYRAQGLKPFLELGFMPEKWRAERRPSSIGRATLRRRRTTQSGRRWFRRRLHIWRSATGKTKCPLGRVKCGTSRICRVSGKMRMKRSIITCMR